MTAIELIYFLIFKKITKGLKSTTKVESFPREETRSKGFILIEYMKESSIHSLNFIVTEKGKIGK